MIDVVTVIGGGTCGCQIAWQCALHGVQTVVVEADSVSATAAQQRLAAVRKQLARTQRWSAQQLLRASQRITLLDEQRHLNKIQDFSGTSDLIIESVPEDLALKRDVFQRYSAVAGASTILATNSSYLLPSSFIRCVQDPTRLASLHFHVPVWYANAVDIMPHARTSPETIDALLDFAERIGQYPVRLNREQPGYVFNSLLHPLLAEAIDLARREVASPEIIDRAWRTITKMEAGPFEMIRLIGQSTVARILRMGAQRTGNARLKLKAEYLENLVLPECALEPPRLGLLEQQWKTAEIDPRIRHRVRLEGTVQIASPVFEEVLAALADSLDETRAIDLHRTREWPEVGLEHTRHLIWHLRSLEPGDDLRFLLTLQSWWKARLHAPEDQVSTLTLLAPATLGLGGMVRALAIELAAYNRLYPTIRLLEHTGRPGEALLWPHLTTEMALAQAEVVVGGAEEATRRYCNQQVRYTASGRQVPTMVTLTTGSPRDREGTARDAAWKESIRGTRWLLVGGGRGITFAKAHWLGEEFGCEVDLLVRSQPITDFDVDDEVAISQRRSSTMRAAYQAGKRPDLSWASTAAAIELTRNLNRLKAAGIRYNLHHQDIASKDAVTNLQSIMGAGRPFAGIIYGAGWEQTSRLDKKTPEAIRATLDSKLVGMEHVMQAVRQLSKDHQPSYFVLSGSLSGMFGGAGQVDYAHANSRAAACLLRAPATVPDCHFVVIDWPGWQDAGMAARASSKFMLQQSGHRLISTDEGLEWLAFILQHHSHQKRVALVDPQEVPRGLRAPENTHHPIT